MLLHGTVASHKLTNSGWAETPPPISLRSRPLAHGQSRDQRSDEEEALSASVRWVSSVSRRERTGERTGQGVLLGLGQHHLGQQQQHRDEAPRQASYDSQYSPLLPRYNSTAESENGATSTPSHLYDAKTGRRLRPVNCMAEPAGSILSVIQSLCRLWNSII